MSNNECNTISLLRYGASLLFLAVTLNCQQPTQQRREGSTGRERGDLSFLLPANCCLLSVRLT